MASSWIFSTITLHCYSQLPLETAGWATKAGFVQTSGFGHNGIGGVCLTSYVSSCLYVFAPLASGRLRWQIFWKVPLGNPKQSFEQHVRCKMTTKHLKEHVSLRKTYARGEETNSKLSFPVWPFVADISFEQWGCRCWSSQAWVWHSCAEVAAGEPLNFHHKGKTCFC